MRKAQIPLILISILSAVFFGILIFYNLSFKDYQQFSYLARSFAQGKLYFLESYGTWWHDAVEFNGHYYWPLGPLPAVLLAPFAAIWQLFKQFFYQGYLQIFFVLGIFYFVFAVAKKFQYKTADSLFFAYAFCFASTFIGVALWPNAWFFGQVVTTFLLFAALHEYTNKKRLWLLGLLMGLTLLTRVTAAFGIVFFALEILLQNREKFIKKFEKLLILGLPVAASFGALGMYNIARFGKFLEQGYSLQMSAGAFAELKSQGIFSLAHIPTNLYYFLISAPTPVFNNVHHLVTPFIKADPWGIGILFTMPYILALFWLKFKDRTSINLLITIIAIALPIFAYYGIGWYQFGYRYSLDFLPFLFFLLMRNYKAWLSQKQNFGSLDWRLKAIIIATSLTNLYLFRTIFTL